MISIPPPSQPGWYLLEGMLRQPIGVAFFHLRLQGAFFDREVPLAPVGLSGFLSSVLLVPEGTKALAIVNDADDLPTIDNVVLKPIGRVEALIRMLAGIQGRHRWVHVSSTAVSAVATLLQAGTAACASLVVSRYLRSLHPGIRSSTTAHVKAGWFRRSEVALEPLDQLQFSSEYGTTGWLSTGNDPKFQANLRENGVVLSPGWYRVRVDLNEHDGHLVAPYLYMDHGGGFTSDASIRLPEYRDSRINALILLKREAQSFRFDPSIRQCGFTINCFDIRRLGRSEALLRMLTGVALASGQLNYRALFLAIWDFAVTMGRHGVSTAAADLFAKQTSTQLTMASSYPEWVRKYDRVDSASLVAQAAKLESGPLISLIVPVYETPELWLRRCIESVMQQAYGNWELCIADDRSPSEYVRRVIDEYRQRDTRIKAVYRELNGHISAASNSALDIAKGEFIGLLDHDDELRPQALLRMAEAIRTKPGLALLYSDEDKIDESGRRFQPNFKPDWNYDLLLSQNYVCHFTVIRTDLVRDVGGFRAGLEGSQDHDLILRCAERLEPRRIHHVPEVLYHWRAIQGSTALQRDAKDYAAVAGMRAVTDHLKRIGANASVEALPHGHYRIRWHVSEPQSKVTVIVPTRDRFELLRNCVESVLERTDYENFELLIVDNQSTDPDTLAYLASLRCRPRVRVLEHDLPFNYAAINNRAVLESDGDIVCLLNNDIEVISDGWLKEMVGHAIRPDIGAVGAMLYYPDDTIQHAGVILGLGGVANHAYVRQPRGYHGHGARALVAQNLSSVTAACLVVRREVYLKVNGLDEQLEVAFNDVDFCLRVREAGYRNLWTPFAELYHHESASRGLDESPEKRKRFVGEVLYMERRWGKMLLTDPAYNPNLTLDNVNFELAFPPRRY